MLANKHFASDNYSGVHAEILEAIHHANSGHATSYGDDRYTAEFNETIKFLFGEQARAFPVFNGTAANVISLQSTLPRWAAIICADSSHINVDEAGAPERVAGLKLLPVVAPDGKLTPDLIAQKTSGIGDVHKPQPLAVSISQTTEMGTCYSSEEVKKIADYVHSRGMILHMDGSRLGNAAVHLNTDFKNFTTDAGVDVLSLGATKNGAMGAEAVVLLNKSNSTDSSPEPVEFIRKINLHLASKMRFISTQLTTLYGTDLWLKSATHANRMAALLRAELEKVNVQITRPTQSNAVFVALDSETASKANKKFMFYKWQTLPNGLSEYRLMCSFDTSEHEVRELVSALTE